MSFEGRGGLGLDETVDLVGMDSFPASDPPSWVGSHAGEPAHRRGTWLLRDVVQRLHDDVWTLSEAIGERHERSPRALDNLERAATEIERCFAEAELPFKRRRAGELGWNVEAVLRGGGRAAESIVVGAHYDSARGSAGVEDNASGVAVLLALARILAGARLARTVRLVAFASERPPHAAASTMGSSAYAAELAREAIPVRVMLNIDAVGLFARGAPTLARSLRYGAALKSDLLLLGDRDSEDLLERGERTIAAARAGIRVSTLAWPLLFTGIRSSAHWSFSRAGVPSIMVTDSAPLWSPTYGSGAETVDDLDYERLGPVCLVLADVVRDFAGATVRR